METAQRTGQKERRRTALTDAAFDQIVSGFYRAATGSLDWPSALRPFQQAVSAWAVYLHGLDTALGRVAFSHVAGESVAEAELDYIRNYHSIDPRSQFLMGQSVGVWMNCWEHFDDAFVAKSSFYQDFLIPYGGRYVSGIKLLQTDDTCVFLGVHRGHRSDVLNAAEIALCQRLARHLSDALRVHGETVRERNTGRLGIELLSRLRAPVALIDEERRLHHLNPSAEALLARGGAVAQRGGRLHCTQAEHDDALLLALQKLLRKPEGGAAAPEKIFVRVDSGTRTQALGLFGEALRPEDTLHAFGGQALAMLVFHEPGQHLEIDPFIAGVAFDLTAAEARVAVAAATGASADEIALQHGVSTHTIRSQLRMVFEKTGVSRQAELVALLALLPTAAWRAKPVRAVS